ncbi:hypothetical protein VNO77_24017 [Canavalia gladiata]|uniref:Uncharacterized protein n=1 Tax=Canavalia gladiata TaxID=3824 RepID=A0AAN9QC81_CANGL
MKTKRCRLLVSRGVTVKWATGWAQPTSPSRAPPVEAIACGLSCLVATPLSCVVHSGYVYHHPHYRGAHNVKVATGEGNGYKLWSFLSCIWIHPHHPFQALTGYLFHTAFGSQSYRVKK